MFIEDFCIAIVIGLFFLFVDYKISIGVVLGNIFSFLNYKFIEYRFNHLTDKQNFFTYLGTFISIGILVVPLLTSFLFPKAFSWIGVMIGLMINKVRLYIGAFIEK